jgi:hypothetical protein
MSAENPLWGAPRIHGELLKLGFEVAQSSVAKYRVSDVDRRLRDGAPSCVTSRRTSPPSENSVSRRVSDHGTRRGGGRLRDRGRDATAERAISPCQGPRITAKQTRAMRRSARPSERWHQNNPAVTPTDGRHVRRRLIWRSTDPCPFHQAWS